MEELRDKNGLTEKEFLAFYDASKFERPSVTVDVIVFNGDDVLLIRRGNHPFLGKLALPGGFLEPDEDAYTAAARELYEETSLRPLMLRMLPAATDPHRDPRTRIVTLPFIAETDGDPSLLRAGDDAADAGWYRVGAERIGGCLKVTLTPCRGGETVQYLARPVKDESGFRADPRWTVEGGDPLACDHAAILASALIVSGRINFDLI